MIGIIAGANLVAIMRFSCDFALAHNYPSLEFEFASAGYAGTTVSNRPQFTCNDSTSSCSSSLGAGAGSLRMSMLPVR
jgi:hypothetical protein